MEGTPQKIFRLMKARGRHPFGSMQIPKIAKFAKFKWQKKLVHSINLRGCPPLGTISLGQAVQI
jgi:hypothetical protein